MRLNKKTSIPRTPKEAKRAISYNFKTRIMAINEDKAKAR